jgi:hypothetical protein
LRDTAIAGTSEIRNTKREKMVMRIVIAKKNCIKQNYHYLEGSSFRDCPDEDGFL